MLPFWYQQKLNGTHAPAFFLRSSHLPSILFTKREFSEIRTPNPRVKFEVTFLVLLPYTHYEKAEG